MGNTGSTYIAIQIEPEDILDMLVNRVKYWTDDEIKISLYETMYDSYVYGGMFDGGEVNVRQIVDNDYINWCTVVYPDDAEYQEILQIYNDQGLGDCSCETKDAPYSYIEAVTECYSKYNNQKIFLCRS